MKKKSRDFSACSSLLFLMKSDRAASVSRFRLRTSQAGEDFIKMTFCVSFAQKEKEVICSVLYLKGEDLVTWIVHSICSKVKPRQGSSV